MPTMLIGTQWCAYGEEEDNDNVDDDDGDDDNDEGTELLIMIPGWKRVQGIEMYLTKTDGRMDWLKKV